MTVPDGPGTGQPREPDRIRCLECGRWFRALPTHLRRAHELTDEDYRLRFAIPAGVPLVCLEWSENQARRNVERDTKRTLTPGGSGGYSQRESVRRRRSDHYARLSAAGRAVSSRVDRTEGRRAMLAPYPVTVEQAAGRIGCTRSVAYTFLSYCVRKGRLRRLGWGLYGEAEIQGNDHA